MATTIYSEIGSNKIKTWMIMILFMVFFLGVSFVLGQALGYGWSWAGMMLIISGAISFFSYYNSDKIVLSMSGAKPADKNTHRTLYTTVENLSIAAGLPMPRVYIIEDPAPNAFATGRDPKHAVVAATTGILEKLNKLELEGVIGHELAHVGNYDTRLMGVVSILVGSIAILADVFMRMMWFRGDSEDNRGNQLFMIIGIIAAILAPIAATLIQLAVSRRREFLADASGALLTRYPDALADALIKISGDRHVMKHASNATAHLYFENPFKADSHRTSWLMNLFSTHPSVEERVKRLRDM